jgi:hypothetical protein
VDGNRNAVLVDCSFYRIEGSNAFTLRKHIVLAVLLRSIFLTDLSGCSHIADPPLRSDGSTRGSTQLTKSKGDDPSFAVAVYRNCIAHAAFSRSIFTNRHAVRSLLI